MVTRQIDPCLGRLATATIRYIRDISLLRQKSVPKNAIKSNETVREALADRDGAAPAQPLPAGRFADFQRRNCQNGPSIRTQSRSSLALNADV